MACDVHKGNLQQSCTASLSLGKQGTAMFETPQEALKFISTKNIDMVDLKVALMLLSGYTVAEDIALGHYLAIDADVPSGEAFILCADNPFQNSDTDELRRDAVPVILRYFPRVEKLLQEIPPGTVKIPKFYSNQKAKTMLGFQPKHNFEQWLRRRLRCK